MHAFFQRVISNNYLFNMAETNQNANNELS